MAKNLKLKAARTALDMTQADLAAVVGVSRQTINAIEKGEYNPTINLCRSKCKAHAIVKPQQEERKRRQWQRI